ncbi:MAG: zinc-binding dehydrogenase [Planctomycetota bacterium]
MITGASEMPNSIDEIPRDSKAAVFQGPGRLELQELPIPELQPGEALVKIDCSTLCGSDLHTFTGRRNEPTPSILGHEAIGRVVRTELAVDIHDALIQVGDRVTWSVAVSCNNCERCKSGLPQKCFSLAKYGHETAVGRTALSGGMSEYILLRKGSATVRIDDQLPDLVASPANCATATIAAGLRAAESVAGRRVLILGAGMLGLSAAAMSRTAGAKQVVVCDPVADRLKLATAFGADFGLQETSVESIREHMNGVQHPFDVILEVSGAISAIENSIALADFGAHVILMGSVMPIGKANIDPEMVVRRWLHICGVHNYAPQDLVTAIEFLTAQHQQFPFRDLVERSFALRDIAVAMEYAVSNRPIRLAICP